MNNDRKEYQRQYREKNKEKIAAKQKEKYEKKKEVYKQMMKENYKNNKESRKKLAREYYAEHKEETKLYPSQCKEYWREQQRKSRATPHGRILSRLRSRIYYALNGKCKSQKTEVLIGCTVDFFLDYIRSKLVAPMTWEGVLSGEVHIDHIRPCSSFNLEDENEQRLCFHYTNLQPLMALDNMCKSDTWISL
jgi:hypothetical protein